MEDTIEIIDEADAILLDEDKFASQHHKVGTLIGLTATPLKGTKHSSEKELLTALGIEVHDSAIPAMGSLPEDLSTISWEQFLAPTRSKNARLVYVTRLERFPAKFNAALPKGFTEAPFDPKTYRKLAPCTVTFIDRRHARGVDFRALAGCGIDLLITCQLPNDRALVQLLGRVGRYGQECSRWKLEEDVDALVDQKAARDLRHKIRAIVQKVKKDPSGKI